MAMAQQSIARRAGMVRATAAGPTKICRGGSAGVPDTAEAFVGDGCLKVHLSAGRPDVGAATLPRVLEPCLAQQPIRPDGKVGVSVVRVHPDLGCGSHCHQWGMRHSGQRGGRQSTREGGQGGGGRHEARGEYPLGSAGFADALLADDGASFRLSNTIWMTGRQNAPVLPLPVSAACPASVAM